MREVQSPVSRDTLREWTEDRHGVYMNVRTDSDKVLTVYNETLFPEISVLFVGDAENFNDTVEICGMYDQRTGEFRFVSSQLSSIVNGISEAECCSGSDRSEDIYAEIQRYAKEAVDQKGYKYENSGSEIHADLQRITRTGLSNLVDYAAMLATRGERSAVLDARDLAVEMLHFWRDGVYDTYEAGYTRLEQQYLEGFDQAVLQAENTGQPPAFSAKQAENLLESLAIHAEAATDNENAFSVWECCRLAKRVAMDYPDQCAMFNGDFTADYSERFTGFGSQDWDHLERGRLQDRQMLIFNHPVPDDQIPEGWHSYHLAGRNIYNVDKLLKAVPENGYVGTVLSPHVLIRASYQSRQIQDQFQRYAFHVNLVQFCEENHLPQPDVSGIEFGRQEQAAPPQLGMGGMS